VKNDDIIREIQSMASYGMGYQVAKSIFRLAKAPPETFQNIGPSGAVARERGLRRPMSQAEAVRIVNAATTRIQLVDEGD
jgi:Lhr-like helicase